jgi:hypothetical protein
MGIIKRIDLTLGEVYDPKKHVSFRDTITVIFKSNNNVNDNKYSSITFSDYYIPAGATFLLFDLITVFRGTNPTLGNINVGIQPTNEGSFFRTVQGTFIGTLGLCVSTLSDKKVAWLSIGFPGGVFGAVGSRPDFYVIVSNLRFVNDETVPTKQLIDVSNPATPDAPNAPTNAHIVS